MLFEIYQIALYINWRANGSFEMLKSTENVNSKDLDGVRNDNMLPLTVLDKKL